MRYLWITLVIALSSFANGKELYGIVEPETKITLSSQIAGLIVSSPKSNDKLNTLKAVIKINDSLIQKKIELAQKKIDLQKTECSYNASKLKNKDEQFNKGFIPKDNYDEFKFNLQRSKDNLEILKAELQELIAQQELYKVYTPSNGIVLETFKQTGEYAKPGEAICIVTDNKSLITCAVPEKYLKLKSLQYFVNKQKLKIHSIHPEMDTATNLVKVQFSYERPKDVYFGKKVKIDIKEGK